MTSHLIPPGRRGRIGEAVTSFALKLVLGPFLPHVLSTSSRSSDRRQRCNRAQNSRNRALGRNRLEMGPFLHTCRIDTSQLFRALPSPYIRTCNRLGVEKTGVMFCGWRRAAPRTHMFCLPEEEPPTSSFHVQRAACHSPVSLCYFGSRHVWSLFEKASSGFGVCRQLTMWETGLGAERAPMFGRE